MQSAQKYLKISSWRQYIPICNFYHLNKMENEQGRRLDSSYTSPGSKFP